MNKKRTRGAGIIIKEDEILLMHRINEREYFVFPGGGMEDGETIEETVTREIKEETMLDVKINKLLYHIFDSEGEQYFYLCDYIKGEPKLSEDSIEKKKMSLGNNFYNPKWVKINEIKNMQVYPLEIRGLVVRDFTNSSML